MITQTSVGYFCLVRDAKRQIGASKSNVFYCSLIRDRFSHRYLSMNTIATIELPMAVTVCLMAQRAKSVVLRSSATTSGALVLILIFKQVGLVCLQHLYSVQGTASLAQRCISLTHKA